MPGVAFDRGGYDLPNLHSQGWNASRRMLRRYKGGGRSGINFDIDQLDCGIEPTDISETGFAVTIQRTHGLLYGVAVNWIAFGSKRP